jgi:hypothetical protein
MRNLRLFSITILITFLSLNAYSQAPTDSTEVDDDQDTTTQVVHINKIEPRKRGVYKTYEEYLNNSPSVDAEFTLTPMRLSRNNDLIAEADVDYKGKRPKKIWGLSDGENVYIRDMVGQTFKNHYFKLQCDGPIPYIFYVEKTVMVPFGLGAVVAVAVAAGTAALPPSVTLMIVRDNTNYLKPVLLLTRARVKRNLAEYPDLLEAYNKEAEQTSKSTKARYITELNKRKIGKQGLR